MKILYLYTEIMGYSMATIKELAELIVSEVRYEGKLIYDTTKPDGTPRKLMDTSKINSLGWGASIELQVGIRKTIKEFILQIK